MPDGKLTLTAVALEAGVSASTVSKVVNGRDDVSAETRSNVLAALERTGYKSPLQRRRFIADQRVVEVVFDALNSVSAIDVLNGILAHAAESEIEVALSVTGRPCPLPREQRARRIVDEGRCGLIVVASEFGAANLDSFYAVEVPTVVVDLLNPPQGNVVSIGTTDWSGGKVATTHLLDLGHRRIAYLGGPDGAECSQARMHGYMAALRAKGLSVENRYIISGPFRPDHGVQGMQTLLQLEQRPSAIFAASDTIALGVLAEARRQNIRVPEEMSLIGFGGSRQAEESTPALTSIKQPLQKMGQTAMRFILRQLSGGALDSRRVELATELVIRDSTAPANLI